MASLLTPGLPADKPDIEHIESRKPVIDDVTGLGHGFDGHGLVKSRFDDMSVTKTVWVFRRAVFFTLCVYTGYMCEGFEVCEEMGTRLMAVAQRWRLHRRQ